MSSSFCALNFLHRATQLCSSGFKQRQNFRPQNAWLRSDEQSQLPSIQDPSREEEPVLLIEYNAKALSDPTDMILETTTIWFCQLEETSSFYYFLPK